MQRMNINTMHLSSMTSQVSLTVWTSMMNVHALVNATWNQTTTKPASIEKNNYILQYISIKI